jgi:hypothetical protein
MQKQTKRVREMMQLTYEGNPHQADSLLEEYNRGTIELNADNSVSFVDLHDSTIIYSASHGQVMSLITAVLAKKGEIAQKNGENTSQWLKSTHSDFSPQFKRTALAFRFIMFAEGLDLLMKGILEADKGGRPYAMSIMQNRMQYRATFASGNKAQFDQAKQLTINPVGYEPFDQYIRGFQQMVREGRRKNQVP